MLLSRWLSYFRDRLQSQNRRRRRPIQTVLGLYEWQLEDRCLLSGGVPVPTGSTTPLNQIMWDGGPPLNPDGKTDVTQAPPMKTVTFQNPTDQTIYPFLRDANSGVGAGAGGKGAYYDPQDYHNQEFRLYVGYVQNGTDYLGLLPHSSITVRVPLVFWNAENTYIATDGTNLIPTQAGQLNPFTYDSTSLRGLTPITTDQPADGYWVTSFTSDDPTASAGFTMLYRAVTPSTPALPAPAQLAEFTIRDTYLANLGLTSPADTQVLIDYDASYVDNAIAPITMEASAVPVQIPTNPYPNLAPNPPTPSFGWTGSNLTFTAMQNHLQDFISNTKGTTAYLGQYFTNPNSPPPSLSPPPPGWPSYYTPPNGSGGGVAGTSGGGGGVKIPGGQNIFLQSPLNGTTSSLDHSRYMLTSGGTEPIQISPGGMPLATGRPTQLPLTLNPAQRNALAAQLESMLQTGPLNLARSINPNTTLGQVIKYDPSGKLLGFAVVSGGQGYTSNVKYKLSGGGVPTSATGTGLVKSGHIYQVNLPPHGGGGIYTSAPSLTFISGGGGGTGAQVYPDIGGGTATVLLNDGVTLPTSQGLTYIFSRPVTDYAATDITNLWYTWAQYYINHYQNFPGESVKGALTLQGDLEHQNQAAFIAVKNSDLGDLTTPLAVGMTVEGPGIDPAAGTKVTVVNVQPDSTKGYTDFYLSQLPGGSTSGTYAFGAPQPLPYSDPTGIESITVTNGGTGYVPPLTVTLSGGNGAGATAVVNGITSGQITSFQITNPGGNYTSEPTVTITGGGGTGAKAKATFANGQVTGITIDPGNEGSGYSMGTTVAITGGGGNGATASAVVNPTTGAVTSIVITNSGHGYSQSPSLTVNISGGNSNATATATVGTYVSTYANLLPTDPNTMLQGGTVLQFAGSVYEALEAEASIPPAQSLRFYNAVMPPPVGLVGTTIGSDLGDLPNSNGGASVLGGQVRDLIKSVLRGVWNFTAVPESTTFWYPNPSAKPVSTLHFNPFNLDPYVWFIHDVLGMSGYGFSTDDDIANVGAFTSPYAKAPSQAILLPNHLVIAFGETSKLPQTQQWFPGVPWGTVHTSGTVSTTNGGKAFVTLAPGGVTPTSKKITAYYQVVPVTPGQSGGAYVLGPGIPAGTTINIRNLENNLSFSLNIPAGQTVTPSGGTVNLTFSGTPRLTSTPPPPTPTPPPTGTSTPTPPPLTPAQAIIDLFDLVKSEIFQTIDQVAAFVDQTLSLPQTSERLASLLADTNRINANPLASTPLGRLVLFVTRIETLLFLLERPKP